MIRNAFPFLFEDIRYELNGQVVDKYRNVGMINAIKTYNTCNKDKESAMFNNSVNAHGHFHTMIPLKMVLGIAEYYDKPITKASQTLFTKSQKR